MSRTAEPVADRILANVAMEPNSGCWLWLGRLTEKGYASLTSALYPGEQKGHRLSYLTFKGAIGDLFVCHSCDVRSCVNPDHLWLGTNADNLADAVAKRRSGAKQNSPRPPSRFRHTSSKLTDELVLLLRAQPFVSCRRLARHLGVHHTTISKAVLGKSYRRLGRSDTDAKAGA